MRVAQSSIAFGENAFADAVTDLDSSNAMRAG
jgi:hypothetical protein